MRLSKHFSRLRASHGLVTRISPTSPRRPSGRPLVFLWALVVLAYAAAFFLASGTSLGKVLDRVGGGSATGWDKVLHASGFFLFGLLLFQFFLVAFAHRRGRPSFGWPALSAFLVGSVYAGIHEEGQALFPGLVPEASDVLADILGLSVVIFLLVLWRSTERFILAEALRPPTPPGP